jgi:hypothetical protein
MEPGSLLERILQFAATLMTVPAFIFVETFKALFLTDSGSRRGYDLDGLL